MKQIILICTMILAISGVWAQECDFSKYSNYIRDNYNVKIKMPKGFHCPSLVTLAWSPKLCSANLASCIYMCQIESIDGKCLILLPELLHHPPFGYKANTAYYLMLGELERSLDIDEPYWIRYEYKENELKPHFKELSQVEADRLFNADCVYYVAELPYSQEAYPYHMELTQKYNHCVGVYIGKENRPAIPIKVFLTEEGKQNEHEYIDALFRGIRYNKKWMYDQEKRDKSL